MSAMMSPASSMPTDRRIRSGATPCGRQLLVGELAVRVARGMKYRSACVGYVRDDRAQFERVHEADRLFAASLDPNAITPHEPFGRYFCPNS